MIKMSDQMAAPAEGNQGGGEQQDPKQIANNFLQEDPQLALAVAKEIITLVEQGNAGKQQQQSGAAQQQVAQEDALYIKA